MILPLLTSTNAHFGIVREYNAFDWDSGYRCNIYPVLTLFGREIAAVNDWDFILTEDLTCEVLALATIAYGVLIDACIFVRGELVFEKRTHC